MATNPADSMPNANEVSDAIAACPFVVVSDVMGKTDTARLADVLLPAEAWSEKDGTVTNSERRVSRQTAFRTAPAGARPDWWAVARVAQKMGYTEAFDYACASEIFAEYAGLSGFENDGTRDFDISAFKKISAGEYNSLKPFQWPQSGPGTGHITGETKRFFSDGGFYTPDGKARVIAVAVEGVAANATKAISDDCTQAKLSEVTSDLPGQSEYQGKVASQSFILNTGRIRDQWHTMTRTGISPRLSSHLGEPFVEINPQDAHQLKIEGSTIVIVQSVYGTALLRALITDRVTVNEVFVPMHWSNNFASKGRVNAMVHPRHDPVSGQPALKNQTVTLTPTGMQTYGFMVARHRTDVLEHDYWAIARVQKGWATEFASARSPEPVMKEIHRNAALAMPGAESVRFDDVNQSRYRVCWFDKNKKLLQAVFIAAGPVELARQAIVSMLDHEFENNNDRLAVVSGAGFSNSEDVGAIVCSCMQVGAKTIEKVISSGCDTIECVGESCGAGTQCGTCRSDIGRMFSATRPNVGKLILFGKKAKNSLKSGQRVN